MYCRYKELLNTQQNENTSLVEKMQTITLYLNIV